MKYTVKHGLLTCLGLAVLAMILPWFVVSSILNISGLQIGSLLTFCIGGLGDLSAWMSTVSTVSGLLSSAPVLSTFWQWLVTATVLIVMVSPFVMTFISLFMCIYTNSKKASVGMLVMQALCTVIGLVYLILLVRTVNTINDVSIVSMGLGCYVYLVASAAALIVSIVLVKRFAEQEAKPVAGDPSKTGVMCIAGEYLGVSLPLEKSTDVIVIGRDASICNLVLTGSKISRKHCEISYSSIRGNYRVVDTSTNGTYVKGGARLERDKATELAPGTVLYLGNEMNSFRLQ